MAHNCPVCYSRCHCGGDIDDIVFDNTVEEARCDHCPCQFDDSDEDDDPVVQSPIDHLRDYIEDLATDVDSVATGLHGATGLGVDLSVFKRRLRDIANLMRQAADRQR